MTTLDVGVGARRIAAHGGAGRVAAVYRMAAYLRFPAGLMALTDGRAPSGPLHLRVATLPVLAAGDPLEIDSAGVRGPHWSVSLGAPTWEGELPRGDRLSWHGYPADTAGSPGRLLGAGGVEALAARIGGRGPGLTPSGDDVLAGVLLVARALRGATAEPELVAAAGSVVTTDVAAAFLAWAARGQCIEPAHGWLAALAEDDPVGAARSLARLNRVGASSGRALQYGLQLAAAQLPCSQTHTTLASERPGFDQRYGRSVG